MRFYSYTGFQAQQHSARPPCKATAVPASSTHPEVGQAVAPLYVLNTQPHLPVGVALILRGHTDDDSVSKGITISLQVTGWQPDIKGTICR